MRIDSYEVQNDRVVAVYISDERRNMKQFRYEQARPRGEWVYKPSKGTFCSVCGWHSIWNFNFCPECGTEMRKEGEAE